MFSVRSSRTVLKLLDMLASCDYNTEPQCDVTTTTTVSLLQHTTTVVLLHSTKQLKCIDVYEKAAGH